MSENSSPQHPCSHYSKGNKKQVCFFANDDYLFYPQWLEVYALTSYRITNRPRQGAVH